MFTSRNYIINDFTEMNNIQIAKAKRLRSTPYTSRIEKQGLKAYTIYNHMLLPAAFEDSIEETYYHLKEQDRCHLKKDHFTCRND